MTVAKVKFLGDGQDCRWRVPNESLALVSVGRHCLTQTEDVSSPNQLGLDVPGTKELLVELSLPTAELFECMAFMQRSYTEPEYCSPEIIVAPDGRMAMVIIPQTGKIPMEVLTGG